MSDTVHLIKPDPAFYQLLMERYDLKAEECVFLDDKEENVQTARDLGWAGIVFKDWEQGKEELSKLGVVTE